MSLNKLFVFAVLILLSGVSANAQAIRDTSRFSTKEAMRFYERPYILDAPDTSFTPILNPLGWVESSTQSRLFCLAMPWGYDMMDKHQSSTNGLFTVLSTEKMDINGVPGTLIKAESEAKPENNFMLNYYRPIDEKSTLMIVAIYPKSQDERLYKRIVATFGTARKKG
jgi:hypothetical protein